MSRDQEITESQQKESVEIENRTAEPTEAEAKAAEEQPLLEEEQKEKIEAKGPTIGELTQQLEEANQRAAETWDQLLRTQAELENLRRRTEKELQNAHKYALEKFVQALLPVVDSLELGIQAAAGDSPDVTKFREGSELTLKQFLAVLEKYAIVAIDPVGEKFNPELHQAVAMEPSAEAEPNTVLKVFQKGYVLHDRLIRPAMVVVAQAEEKHIDEQA